MPKVFVYGSLRQGFQNHHWLKDSVRLGSTQILPEWSMFDHGAFPALVHAGETAVVGEVYDITDETLEALDRLEMCPEWFQRKCIETEFGTAWIYHLPASEASSRIISSGDWAVYYGEKAAPSDFWFRHF